MKELTLGGLSVRSPLLGGRCGASSRCGPLLLLNSRTRSSVLSALRRHGEFGGFGGVCAEGERLDLGFLSDFPNLRFLEVRGGLLLPEQLAPLVNLRGLLVNAVSGGIDFSSFPHLEEFRGPWHAANTGIAACRKLRKLWLTQYRSKSGGLQELAGCIRLECLGVADSPIETLDGISSLEDLRYLTLAHTNRLTSVAELGLTGRRLREVDVEKATSLRDYAPLGRIELLRMLRLVDCGPMKSLAWMKSLSALEEFSFVGTDVIDGDLNRLTRLPALRYVNMSGKRHFSHTASELERLLRERQV